MPSIRHGCLLVALLLTGCASSEHSDLKEFVAQSEQGLRGRVEVLPAPRGPDAVAYEAVDEPDPFSPTRTRAPSDRTTAVATRWVPPASREALEAYPLESLRMVGTMQRHGQRWALIQTPDNAVYRITQGNRLGENFGAVADITDTALTLHEHVDDGSGLWTERLATLNLVEDTRSN